MDPGEDVDLVAFDALGAEEDLVGDFAWDAEDAVDVAEDDVAGSDGDFADADGYLVVGDHAASERAVGGAVLVEDGEVLLEDLLGVADAAGDDGAADLLGLGGGGHDAAPEGCLGVLGGVPDDDALRLHVVEHLGAEGHFALDHAVGRGLDGEGLAADDHFVAEGHDVGGEVLVEEAVFAEDIIDASGVELLVAFAEFGDGDGEFVGGDVLAVFDELVELHETGFLGLFPHVLE